MNKLLLTVILAMAGASAPLADANATILFAGGEDIDFTIIGNPSVITNAGYFASGYAREGMLIGNTVTPTTNYILSPTFTASSTVWVHATWNSAQYGDNANAELLGVLSPDGVTRIMVRGTSTSGEYKISTNNAAGTVTDLVTMSAACFGTSLQRKLDLYINYGTSGEVTLYCNGVSYADYTGNVTTNSATQLNQLLLSAVNANCCGAAWGAWSEVIVSTTDTRNMRLVTLAAVANGNTHNWDTGGVSNVNETTDNTATVNASGTAGQIQEYTVGALPSGAWVVNNLWLNMKAQVDTTGPQHIEGVVRTNSTDYTSSNLSPPQGSWGWISTDWTTNPNTGVAWTTGDLGAAGFNLGFESQN